MPLELYVWGPGFGLPSIDAECIGAIAYLRRCLPDEGWKLVASSDPKACPLGELPALKDGDQWVSRFNNIVEYLRDLSNGDWDLDRSLSRKQKADCVAFASFVESRGKPLLDLSLYVSSDNYNGSTRVALSHVLTWPGSWTTPGQLRDRAKKRSEHLGLSSLDVDATLEEANQNDTGLTAHIPERLRKPKQTVSALLGNRAGKDRFRLDAVTDEFMEPIQELLGEKEHLLSEDITSLDCLSIGYLAIMQRPDLSHGWLEDALRAKYTRLGQWSEGFSKATFQALPWLQPTPVTGSERVLAIIEDLFGALPVIGRPNGVTELSQRQSSDYATKQKTIVTLRHEQRLFDQVVFSSLGFGLFLGYMFYVGLLVLPRRATKASRRDFGAAGAMLGLGLR